MRAKQQLLLYYYEFPVLHGATLIILCKWLHLLFVLLHKVMKKSLSLLLCEAQICFDGLKINLYLLALQYHIFCTWGLRHLLLLVICFSNHLSLILEHWGVFVFCALKCILLINLRFWTVYCSHVSCQSNLRRSMELHIVLRKQMRHPPTHSEQCIKSDESQNTHCLSSPS